MDLPKAVRLVGTIEKKRVVYIEDYVLQYLTVCEEDETEQDALTVLYGKKEINGETKIYMIYGIYKQTGQDYAGQGDIGQELGKKYIRLGYLHKETGAIVLDDWGREQTLKGYYVFYHAEERMKDYLAEYYTRQLQQKKQNPSGKTYQETGAVAEAVRMPKSNTAELVALSNVEHGRRESPFLWIRMVVVCIFIIFCAIAVLTVNNYDKLNDFVQTAVLTGEIMDTDEKN